MGKTKGKREIKENVTIVRSFADDTRVSRKISGKKDKDKFQRHLNMIYRWAERNKMVLNAGKFEQVVHGKSKEDAIPYKNPEGKDIKVKLGKIASAEIMTSFGIREKETMLLSY